MLNDDKLPNVWSEERKQTIYKLREARKAKAAQSGASMMTAPAPTPSEDEDFWEELRGLHESAYYPCDE